MQEKMIPYSQPIPVSETGSLTLLEAKIEQNIDENEDLSSRQKKKAKREMHFLIEVERVKRASQLIWNIEDEQRNRLHNSLIKMQSLKDDLLIKRYKLKMRIQRIKEDLVKSKVRTAKLIRSSRPRNKTSKEIGRLKREFFKRKIALKLSRQTLIAVENEIRNKALRRARFMKYIKKHYPDYYEELIEHYDRQLYGSLNSDV